MTKLQRQVVELRFIAGLSLAETAGVMGRKENAIKALQHSALGALRRLLGSHGLKGGCEMSTSGMHISDALTDCLDLLSLGRTVEECLERYPDLSDELGPLLRLSIQTQMAAETVVPSPEAQRAGLGRITDAWTAMQDRRRHRSPWRVLRRTWVLAAVAALVLAFGGWTTAAAAQDSIPGDTLYPVKEAQERVLLLVVFTDGGKADLHARLAEARTVEATQLAAQGSGPRCRGQGHPGDGRAYERMRFTHGRYIVRSIVQRRGHG